MNNKRRQLALLAALAATLAGAPAQAVEADWSGFATLGYARSNSPYSYQRFIDDGGTFKRDSLVAGQVDLRFTPQWSATLQVKATPSEDSDSGWQARANWAFVGWRPNNDWLLRAGRLRVPLYLHSESIDVGVSHDMARMPFEMYSIAPTNDFTGLFATRNFTAGPRDLSVDAYAGQATSPIRSWTRDGLPGAVSPGAFFYDADIKVFGIAFTASDDRLTWRLGLHSTRSETSDGTPIPVTFPRVELDPVNLPGVGYWQVNDALPGPGVPTTQRIRNLVVTAGAELQLDQGWRVSGEFIKIHQRDTELGEDSMAGYLAAFKRSGDFTPYVSISRKLSSRGIRDWHQRLTTPGLPGFIPGADLINAAQRLAGETLRAYDQRSLAVGTSYDLSPTTKLKAEWMHTRIGAMSHHFDTPPGQPDLHDQSVNTLSFNVNVAF